ncbi:retrovirus-related pol polyprotein from transposon TNT 1-94 [Tanacetum coccineum]
MSKVKKTDHCAAVLASIQSQVPIVVDKYLGTKVDDALLKALKKHTADLIQKYSGLPAPESSKKQESEKSPEEILRIEREQEEQKHVPTYTIKSTDTAALKEFDLKAALFKTIHENKSANKNPANNRLYHAFMEALIEDENAMEKEVADKVKDHKRRHDSDDDEDVDDEGHPAGSNQGKSTKRRRHDSGASGSAQPPSKDSEQSTKNKLDSDASNEEQDSDSDDNDNAHVPKVQSTTSWFRPIPEEDRPATPEPEWTIPSNDSPEPENNWENIYATTYQDPEENKLQRKMGDIGSFIKCISLQFQMDECYKLLTDKVDLVNPEGHQILRDKERKTALSISKLKAARYLDFGLEKLVPSLWVESERDYDINAAYGITHWWVRTKEFYINKHREPSDRDAVRSHIRILSVICITTYERYGYSYLREIVLRRADYKEYKISEKDFKNLYPNDFEDLFLLHLQDKLNHLPKSDKVNLHTTVNMWIRNIVIRKRVEDLQLGVESYQTKLNLEQPNWDASDFLFKEDYTIVNKPRAVIYRDRDDNKKMMRINEVHKFSDGTLMRIRDKLDFMVKDFRLFKFNKGMETRKWTEDDKRRSEDFIEVIEKRLKIRRIFRSLESFVGGRLRDIDYRLISRTDSNDPARTGRGSAQDHPLVRFDIEKVAVSSSLRSLKPKRTIESRAKRSSVNLVRTHCQLSCLSHTEVKQDYPKSPTHYPYDIARTTESPSETKVFSQWKNENPARADINKLLVRSKLPQTPDIFIILTSAQDGDPLQDDVILCWVMISRKLQDHNQDKSKDNQKITTAQMYKISNEESNVHELKTEPSHHGFCCLDISIERLYIARHVRFNEAQFPSDIPKTTSSPPLKTSPYYSSESPYIIPTTDHPSLSSPRSPISSPSSVSHLSPTSQTSPASSNGQPSPVSTTSIPTPPPPPPITRQRPANLCQNPKQRVPYNPFANHATVLPTTITEPTSFTVANNSLEWRQAIKEELKQDKNGAITHYKARFIAKVFRQQPDVQNAFLHGNLKDNVYMKQPLGFIDPQRPNHVYFLHKSLYGLKQAPHAWFKRLFKALFDLGFKGSKTDPSLFIYSRGHTLLYILVYVDDNIVTGNNKGTIDNIICQLGSAFALKDLGPLNYFWGIEIVPHVSGILLSQKKYILELLQSAGLSNWNPMSSLMVTSSSLSLDDSTAFSNPVKYRQVLGSLQYVILSRPDIAFDVNKVIVILLEAFSYADWAGDSDNRRSIGGFSIYRGSNLISWTARKQRTVSRSSTEAEYKAFADTVVELTWLQALLNELGIHSSSTLILWCDNLGATQLTLSFMRVQNT